MAGTKHMQVQLFSETSSPAAPAVGDPHDFIILHATSHHEVAPRRIGDRRRGQDACACAGLADPTFSIQYGAGVFQRCHPRQRHARGKSREMRDVTATRGEVQT